MNSLIPHIEYLLHSHDCVIVPEWGAFIVQRENASICVDTSTIIPPHVSISFNPEIKHNDGLLALSISRKNDISYESAVSIMKTAVEDLKARFESYGELDFGVIGIFQKEHNRKVFRPNDRLFGELYGEYGLCDIKAAKLSELLRETSDQDRKRSRGRIYLNRVANYAASVVILLGLILTLSTPAELNLTASEQASLSLLKKQDQLIKDIENKSGELLISMPPANSVAEVSIANDDEEIAELNECDFKNDKFFLVVASFYNEKDASRFISHAKDNRLKYINMDGKFRVFVSSAMDIETLARAKTILQIADLYSDAWICKK